MNKKFVGFSILGMFLASLLGAGLVYAANGGPSATDKKQLGLFSGNGDFIGTVLDVNKVEYTVFNSSLNAVINIFGDHDYGGFLGTVLAIDDIYFEGPDCTGKAFFDLHAVSGGGGIVPQELFVRHNSNRTYVDSEEISLLDRAAISSLDENNICRNFPTQLFTQTRVIREVTLPFTLVGPLTIKPL